MCLDFVGPMSTRSRNASCVARIPYQVPKDRRYYPSRQPTVPKLLSASSNAYTRILFITCVSWTAHPHCVQSETTHARVMINSDVVNHVPYMYLRSYAARGLQLADLSFSHFSRARAVKRAEYGWSIRAVLCLRIWRTAVRYRNAANMMR